MSNPIRAYRKRLGLSQPQLALPLGISHGVLAMWERGEYLPTAARMKVLAKLMGVGEAELLTELSTYREYVRRGVAKKLSAALVA
jgi:transcriptional regulator with XRE-family HTH domain